MKQLRERIQCLFYYIVITVLLVYIDVMTSTHINYDIVLFVMQDKNLYRASIKGTRVDRL